MNKNTWNSQRVKLLRAFMLHPMIDEEAAQASGVSMRTCFWKRCGELREHGLIEWATDGVTGERLYRKSSLGGECGVSRITDEGKTFLIHARAAARQGGVL